MAVRFRFHRGSLEESMQTVVELGSIQDLGPLLIRELGIDPKSQMTITPYCYDERIDWDTYIVTVDGYGVVGFLDYGF